MTDGSMAATDMTAAAIHVLLIEPATDVDAAVCRMLSGVRGHDFHIIHCQRLSDGLSHLSGEVVDVVLLDLDVPDCSGAEAFARVNARAPDLPILLLASPAQVASARQAVGDGAQAYLVKGAFDAETLISAVERAGERKRVELLDLRHLAMLNAMTELILELTSATTVENLCRRAVSRGVRRLGVDTMSVWLREGEGVVLRGSFGAGAADADAQVDAGADTPMGRLLSGRSRLETEERDGEGTSRVLVPLEGRGGGVIGIISAGARGGRAVSAGYLSQMLRLYGLAVGHLLEAARVEEALRESRRLFRALAQTSAAAMVIHRGETLLYVNPATIAITGYSEDELLTMDLARLIHPSYRDTAQELGLMRLDGAAAGRYEIKLLRKDGGERWADLNVRPIEYEGRPGVMVTAFDITDRKRAEAALQENERRYRLLAENVSDVIWTMDLNGRFTYVSPSITALLGCGVAQMMQRTWEDLLAPGSLALGYAAWKSERAAERAGRGDPFRSRSLELEMRGLDGSMVWTDSRMTFLRDGQGRAMGILGVTRDISEQKKAQDKLTRYTERLKVLREIDEAIVAAESLDAIVHAALDHLPRLAPCRYAGVAAFDFEAGSVTFLQTRGTRARDLATGASLPLASCGELNERLRAGEMLVLNELAALPRPPRLVEALVAEGVRSFLAAPLATGGQVIGCLFLGTAASDGFNDEHVEVARELADVLGVAMQQARMSEQIRRHAAELETRVQERTAELREINAELESFSHSVSHDLRRPLRAVMGYGRILLEGHAAGLGEEGRRLLSIVYGSTRRMDQLVRDLLEFSRLGRQEMRLDAIDMNRLVHLVCREFEVGGSRALAWEIADLPPARGDQPLIRQVLVNLVSNAVKFTERAAEPRIIIGAGSATGQNMYFVRDNGVGFDMKYSHKLFGVFQRLHSDSEFEGTGVGLANVQRIVRRHGGRVWAEGKPNLGATFYFTLPPLGAEE